MRCVNSGYVTVRKSVAGGANAVVGIGFSSIGTSNGRVTVRLFFTAGRNGILRVSVFFLFCAVGFGLSVSSATHIVLCGFGVAGPLLLEVWALWLFVLYLRWGGRFHLCVVRLVLRCWSGHGRRPGRGINVGLECLAFHVDLCGQQCAGICSVGNMSCLGGILVVRVAHMSGVVELERLNTGKDGTMWHIVAGLVETSAVLHDSAVVLRVHASWRAIRSLS